MPRLSNICAEKKNKLMKCINQRTLVFYIHWTQKLLCMASIAYRQIIFQWLTPPIQFISFSSFNSLSLTTGIINHHEYTQAQVRPECQSLVPAWYCHKALIKHIVYSPTASRPRKATLSGSLESAAPISTLSKYTSISISFTTFSDQQF